MNVLLVILAIASVTLSLTLIGSGAIMAFVFVDKDAAEYSARETSKVYGRSFIEVKASNFWVFKVIHIFISGMLFPLVSSIPLVLAVVGWVAFDLLVIRGVNRVHRLRGGGH